VFPAAQMVGGTGAVFALDVQQPVLRHIERTAKSAQLFNIYPVWSDFDVYRGADIAPHSLDLVLLANNLTLSQNHGELLREMSRLVRPGGRIVVIDWKDEELPMGPAMRYSPSQAKELFVSPLVRQYDEFDAGPYHYGLIFLRTERSVA